MGIAPQPMPGKPDKEAAIKALGLPNALLFKVFGVVTESGAGL
jgi:hypothetical protein